MEGAAKQQSIAPAFLVLLGSSVDVDLVLDERRDNAYVFSVSAEESRLSENSK